MAQTCMTPCLIGWRWKTLALNNEFVATERNTCEENFGIAFLTLREGGSSMSQSWLEMHHAIADCSHVKWWEFLKETTSWQQNFPFLNMMCMNESHELTIGMCSPPDFGPKFGSMLVMLNVVVTVKQKMQIYKTVTQTTAGHFKAIIESKQKV